MNSAAHEDDGAARAAAVPTDRPTVPTLTVPSPTSTPPTGIPSARTPTARRAREDAVVRSIPPRAPRQAPLDVLRRAGSEREGHLDRLVVEVEADARAAMWALRLVGLGVIGLVLLLLLVI